MAKKHIDHIEIKHFKCFKNFKANGFKRVNLIGGYNNVGKTALMEACFLSGASSTQDLYGKLLELQTHRNIVNHLLLNSDRQHDIQQLIMDSVPLSIFIKDSYDSYSIINEGTTYEDYSPTETIICGKIEIKKDKHYGVFNIYTQQTPLEISDIIYHPDDPGNPTKKGDPQQYSYAELTNIIDISLENTKYRYSRNFISPYSNSDKELINMVGQFKLDNKYDLINQYLHDVFSISAIDIIKNKPMLKLGNQYHDLSTFGQGVKTFINIIGSLLLSKDTVIFIDEVENGIHYSHFNQLWNIILTLSKQQNVQVFATTHSKECIEAYAHIAKKLADKEISYIKMTRLKKGEIMAGINDEAMLHYMLDDGHEVRGC